MFVLRSISQAANFLRRCAAFGTLVVTLLFPSMSLAHGSHCCSHMSHSSHMSHMSHMSHCSSPSFHSSHCSFMHSSSHCGPHISSHSSSHHSHHYFDSDWTTSQNFSNGQTNPEEFGLNGAPTNVSSANINQQVIPIGVQATPVGAEAVMDESMKTKHHGIFGWLHHSKKHMDADSIGE